MVDDAAGASNQKASFIFPPGEPVRTQQNKKRRYTALAVNLLKESSIAAVALGPPAESESVPSKQSERGARDRKGRGEVPK